MYDTLAARIFLDPTVPCTCGSRRDVRVGLIATLLVGLSTVLARCPRPDGFEDCFTAVLADEQSTDELEAGSVSDLAIR